MRRWKNEKILRFWLFCFFYFQNKNCDFRGWFDIFFINASMKKWKDPPFFETFFLKTFLDIYFCPFSKNKIECWKRKSRFFTFFFDDIFSHFIMVNSKTIKHKYAVETISEKSEKLGKKSTFLNFLDGGGVKPPSA